MSDQEEPGIEYREANEMHESTATQFQISPQGDLVALYFGEEKYELQSDGSSQVGKVVYDTKVKLTAEGAYALRELLNDVLSEGEDGGKSGQKGLH